MIRTRKEAKISGLWQQALLVPAALIAIYVLVMNGGIFLALAAGAPGQGALTFLFNSPLIFLFTGLVLGVLEILTYRALVGRFAKRRVTELGRVGCFKETALGVLVGAVLISLPMLILLLGGWWRFESFSLSSAILTGVSIGLVACVFEELLMRGILLRLVDAYWGPATAIIVSSLVFAGLHLMNPGMTWLGIIALTIEAGPVLGVAYLWRRRLWFPIGLHFGWNTMQAAFWGVNVSGTGSQIGLLNGTMHGPEWITGGSVGIEGSMITAVIGAIAAGVIWKLRPRTAPQMTPYEPGTNATSAATDADDTDIGQTGSA